MDITFGMVVLYVTDLEKSVEFYRLLGLTVPDPYPDRPVSAVKLGEGVTMILTTGDIARRFDGAWTEPADGYKQLIEFFVDDDDAVDAVWATMTGAGYAGLAAPGNLMQPYATLIADPDGHAVLVTHDQP